MLRWTPWSSRHTANEAVGLGENLKRSLGLKGTTKEENFRECERDRKGFNTPCEVVLVDNEVVEVTPNQRCCPPKNKTL